MCTHVFVTIVVNDFVQYIIGVGDNMRHASQCTVYGLREVHVDRFCVE